MAENPKPVPVHHTSEVYTIGHADDTLRSMQQRTLATCAPFFLPYLRPGFFVLDCGCGPGSLTVELAERVAPGEVVGIDLGAQALDQARALLWPAGSVTSGSKRQAYTSYPTPPRASTPSSPTRSPAISVSQHARSWRCGGC
jgi:Methyltransferase domain